MSTSVRDIVRRSKCQCLSTNRKIIDTTPPRAVTDPPAPRSPSTPAEPTTSAKRGLNMNGSPFAIYLGVHALVCTPTDSRLALTDAVRRDNTARTASARVSLMQPESGYCLRVKQWNERVVITQASYPQCFDWIQELRGRNTNYPTQFHLKKSYGPYDIPEEITDNSGQPPHKSPKGSSTDAPSTKPKIIEIPSSSSSDGEDSNFDMAEFMRANANALKAFKKFKFTEAKDGKRHTCVQELVQKLLTVTPDHADFASTFSNVVEKHANGWRNNEATSVLCESLYLWMKHCKCPIHRSILIQIELDTGANRKLLMNNGNTRLFTTASNWFL